MLRLLNLALSRGTRVLYRHATLTAAPGERIGLVGPNGCGKSTLFAAMLGDLSPEDGDIETPPRDRIAHVAQSFVADNVPAVDFVLGGHAPLIAARAALAEAEKAGDDMRLAQAHANLAELNEGAIVAQARTILAGLGFSQTDVDRPVYDFSGGWRNRIALARALMCPADLLLLDEPTNHLDIDSLIWLENWLRRVEATVVIISHDREFLDRAVTTIWSVEDDTVCRYAGNYSAFESQRIEKLRLQDAAAKAYEREASHLSSFIERFRAKATKARQAQSRIKMLEKLKAVEPVRAKREWRFEFPKPVRLPEHLVDTENLRLGYDERVVIDRVTLSIRSGERIGILGVNGAGKSTLVKGIVGDLAPMAGELRRGQGLEIGYFAQHQLDQLRPDESPLEHMRRMAPDVREQDLRDYLGIYRFSGDFASAPVGPMSGGEKARLALALLAWRKPNLLVLDEPTNHLDLRATEWLEAYLLHFRGTVLVISHDRYFLDRVVQRSIDFTSGQAEFYSGNYSFYVVERQRRFDEQLKKYEKDQAKLQQLTEAAAKLHLWAFMGNDKLHKRAFSIEKRMEKLETTERPTEARKLNVHFTAQEFRGDDVLTMAGLSKHYGERTLFHDLDLTVTGGERIALIGDNGAGKTTFLKLVMNEETPDTGWVQRGPSVRTAYLPQIVRFAVPERSMLDTMLYECKCTPQEARDQLGAYGFCGEDVLKPVSALSGGELSRLRLCMLMRREINFLILDEPTNHLDIASREWIEDALSDYTQALLFVSHDRYFIEKFATRIWLLENGTITDYRGTYEQFREYRARQTALQQTAKAVERKKEPKPKPKRAPNTTRQRERTEREIEKLEGQLAALDAESEANATDYQKLMELDAQKQALNAQLEALYEAWEALCE